MYGRGFEAIKIEVPLERDLRVIRQGDSGSGVEGGEDPMIVESPNGECGDDCVGWVVDVVDCDEDVVGRGGDFAVEVADEFACD